MNLILLGGNNWRNKGWIEEVEKALKPDFDQTWVQYYDHWQVGPALIDMEVEMEKLVKKAAGFGEYIIFGKSAGPILAMRAIKERGLRPGKCVFVGTAVSWGEKQGFEAEKWLEGYAVRTLFIQRAEDQVMTAGELREALNRKGVTNYKFTELPGRSHHYEDIFGLRMMVKEFAEGKA